MPIQRALSASEYVTGASASRRADTIAPVVGFLNRALSAARAGSQRIMGGGGLAASQLAQPWGRSAPSWTPIHTVRAPPLASAACQGGTLRPRQPRLVRVPP